MLPHLMDTIVAAISLVSTPQNLFWIFSGTMAGIIIGAIPGIGSALGTALALPFTVYLDPLSALLFIVSLYGGAMFGGSIPSILMNTPGDGAAAASTIEGYPLAKKGKAVTALAISSTASAMGGVIGSAIAILGSVFMLPFLLLFGTPEYFLLGVFGIVLVALVTKGTFYKALISGLLGLSVTLIGIAPGGSAEVRYSFNMLALYDGVSFLPILLGLFGVATMAGLFAQKTGRISLVDVTGGGRVDGMVLAVQRWWTLIKSSIIGFLIGAIPGTGGTVATFIAYGEAVRSGKGEEVPFGQGNPSGLVATESSNNACVSGALVPTLLFGIPGSATTAIVLAAMLLHGMRPGMAMFDGSGYAMTLSLFVGLVYCDIIIAVVGLSMVRILGKLTVINKHIIILAVVTLSMIGIYTYHFNWLDVFVMVMAGVVGSLMTKFGFPIIPAVIGVVLGQIIEENLLRTLELGGGSLSMIVHRPISILLLVLTLLMIVMPIISGLRAKSPSKDKRMEA